jgi:D-alanine-D-alanine ligase
MDTYTILDCHDYGRVEARVDREGNPYVLELNPNPSINIGDCVPAVAGMVGMDYGDFVEKIISLAIKRYTDKPPYYHLQPTLL